MSGSYLVRLKAHMVRIVESNPGIKSGDLMTQLDDQWSVIFESADLIHALKALVEEKRLIQIEATSLRRDGDRAMRLLFPPSTKLTIKGGSITV